MTPYLDNNDEVIHSVNQSGAWFACEGHWDKEVWADELNMNTEVSQKKTTN